MAGRGSRAALKDDLIAGITRGRSARDRARSRGSPVGLVKAIVAGVVCALFGGSRLAGADGPAAAMLVVGVGCSCAAGETGGMLQAGNVVFMDPVLVVYAATATDTHGVSHTARACAREQAHGRWEVWFELEPEQGGSVLRTPVETTQPDRESAARWACGISRVYLNGALARASSSVRAEAPARTLVESREEREAVLDPVEVAAGGEEHLRCRLGALSTAHLRDVARAQRALPASRLARSTKRELVASIIASARSGE